MEGESRSLPARTAKCGSGKPSQGQIDSLAREAHQEVALIDNLGEAHEEEIGKATHDQAWASRIQEDSWIHG